MARAELKDLIPDGTRAELELVARYGMLADDPRRTRNFAAFAKTGLPHRRIEGWRWSDVRTARPALDPAAGGAADDPFSSLDGPVIRLAGGRVDLPDALPDGLRVFTKEDTQALGGAEDLPLGALTAALCGTARGPCGVMVEVTGAVSQPLHIVHASTQAETSFGRVTLLVRPGASLDLIERQLGGAGFSGFLLDAGVQAGGTLRRTLYQAGGGDEVAAVTADIRLDAGAVYEQVALAFGAKLARIETRLVHQQAGSSARLDAAYLAGAGRHVDFTSLVRHGAQACTTRQLTKGAVRKGGRGVFQGKFLVPRHVGQETEAAMDHHALLLEDGAEVFAKPELEIYADDVECAHGNTSGALDGDQLFYLRQRGLPEVEARAMLTGAYIAEALQGADDMAGDVLRQVAGAFLSGGTS